MAKIIFNIKWDTEDDGEVFPASDLGLPEKIVADVALPPSVCEAIINTMDADSIVDQLSDEYGYCIESFIVTVEE